ncbi:unnamed protein product [Vitrella brassicaformis CCMP3155]|uniref:F-box domain-containing protein n=1 Tax=Vitrella brassicaformis (strain CCMP3155) TaxID=1169540 RepID=A0A0G4FZ40_VITBC|nr:unnamed protein product [Vitrella brassicaformis CCMP3155]|mmetsp:Transcript_41814/g.104380  ORF Transcript_41814/g.104380 Transcript_41814/m.104380 type:complete len:616 (-) Transcript_41814:1316-3163(-)|eukprot:CEM20696.1 unnamed protein product [Vitrella brassicaformis CCMP3155]
MREAKKLALSRLSSGASSNKRRRQSRSSDACGRRPPVNLIQLGDCEVCRILQWLTPREMSRVSLVCKTTSHAVSLPLAWAALEALTVRRCLRLPTRTLRNVVARFSTVARLELDLPSNVPSSNQAVGIRAFRLFAESFRNLEVLSCHYRPSSGFDMGVMDQLLLRNANSLKVVKLMAPGGGWRVKSGEVPSVLNLPARMPNLEKLTLSALFKMPSAGSFEAPRCRVIRLLDMGPFKPPFQRTVTSAVVVGEVRNLLKQTAPSLRRLQLDGDGRPALFSFTTTDRAPFYPVLNKMNLGWTTTEELLAIDDGHPKHFPQLTKLSFHGPPGRGLTDLHLRLYAKLNEVTPHGVYFKYGSVEIDFPALVNFRLQLAKHGLFLLHTDETDNLHYLSVESALDIPSDEEEDDLGEGPLCDKTSEWQKRFQYRFIKGPLAPPQPPPDSNNDTDNTPPDTQPLSSGGGQGQGEPSSADGRVGGGHHPRSSGAASAAACEGSSSSAPNGGCEEGCEEEDEASLRGNGYPRVGESMKGYDMFCLEMWNAPKLCRDLSDTTTLQTLWRRLKPEQRRAWGTEIVEAYKSERSKRPQWHFDRVKPWWETTNGAGGAASAADQSNSSSS